MQNWISKQNKTKQKKKPSFPNFWVGRKRANIHLFFFSGLMHQYKDLRQHWIITKNMMSWQHVTFNINKWELLIQMHNINKCSAYWQMQSAAQQIYLYYTLKRFVRLPVMSMRNGSYIKLCRLTKGSCMPCLINNFRVTHFLLEQKAP